VSETSCAIARRWTRRRLTATKCDVGKHKHPNWAYSAPVRVGRNKRQVKRAFLAYGAVFDTRQLMSFVFHAQSIGRSGNGVRLGAVLIVWPGARRCWGRGCSRSPTHPVAAAALGVAR
jgi:hypothetical protein